MLAPVIVLLVVLGFFAGAYGALVGLGGGIILVPVLSIWLGVPIKTAVGIGETREEEREIRGFPCAIYGMDVRPR